jgi:AraC-like DNA-binding protein
VAITQHEREAYAMAANRAELVERILRANRADGAIEPLKGLYLNRVSRPRRLHSVAQPSFCVVAQGSKAVFLSDERYQYDPNHYLLVTAELPVVSQVIEASSAHPYLSFRIELDPILVGTILVETGRSSPQNGSGVRAIDVSALDAALLDAMVRLIRLIDTPAEAPFMRPLITRELVYRLLQGEQGDRLRHIAVLGGQHHRMVKAIERLRTSFDQPLRIEEVAGEVGMSVSSFHHHFKAVTAMTPLQFQKQLQLQEARRLMLGEDLDAATAGSRVGYNDAAHFSREYKRLFGLPPMRDVERLRQGAQTDVEH